MGKVLKRYKLPVLIVVLLVAAVAVWWVRGNNSSASNETELRNVVLQPHDPNAPLPSDEQLRQLLSSEQYYVTQEDGTEPPFENEYWDYHEEGIYVDVVSGEPLFSSTDKFDSDTGWPSFSKPIDLDSITKHEDTKLVVPRIEIRSAKADSHLGHVFEDGPEELGGLRYCMNSAALQFIPQDRMSELGYGKWLYLFEN